MSHSFKKQSKLKGKIILFFSFLAIALVITPILLGSLVTPVFARTQSERQAEADRLFQQGIKQAQISQYSQAIQSWQLALEIYRDIDDRNGEASSLGNLGIAYRNLGKYPQAIEYYQKSLAISQEIGDLEGEAKSLNNLGIIYDISKGLNTPRIP
ncbi:MAG: tetratricopeptide repeat protein [Xenococcus sp. (in: cyanobacteria)]